MTIREAVLDENDELIVSEFPATAVLRLQGAVDNGVGIQAGYGNLGLSLSKTFHGQGTNRTFSFDYQSAGYALQVQFFNLSKPVEYTLSFDGPSGPFPSKMSGFTAEPGRMRALIVDAFYSFNRRTFAYSAAYKGNVFQRRSAGSWMFGTKLSFGDFNIDPDDIIVGLSAGYSKPRYPSEADIPTILSPCTDNRQDTGNGGYTPVRKSKINGNLMVNYVYRVGVAFTRDLYTFNLSANSDSYSYEGISTIPSSEIKTPGIKTSGTFMRWTVGLRVSKRF